jgi:superfamily II DNA or RNA helicase
MQLYPHQSELEAAIYHQWELDAHANIMAVLATGGGKTVIFAKILSKHVGAAVAIAHRQELVEQISLALAREGVRHRLIAPKQVIKRIVSLHMSELGVSYFQPGSLIAVAGVDTLKGRTGELNGWLQQVTLAVMDEGHHVLTENKWGKAFALFPNARCLLVTATPCRADGKGLGSEFDGIVDVLVEGPGMRWLIDHKYLSDYRIFCPPSDLDLAEVTLASDGDYNKIKLREAVHESTIMGDVVEHYLRIAPGKLGITFAPGVEIATEMAGKFNQAGVRAEVISGKTDSRLRADILRRYRKREILMLVNVDLFGEGFDLPGLEVVIFARPTQSFGLYCQQFGRALRILQGKTIAIIIDHVGNVLRHGLPDAEREWSLARRDKRTRAPYDDEIPLKVCTNKTCLRPYEAILKACPYCENVPVPQERGSPEQVDGDLCELSPEALAEMRGAIARIDGPALVPQHLEGYKQQGVRNAHHARQLAQTDLREVIAYWAGMQPGDVSEIQKKFFFTFGVDTMTPLAYGKPDANLLRQRIQQYIGDHI